LRRGRLGLITKHKAEMGSPNPEPQPAEVEERSSESHPSIRKSPRRCPTRRQRAGGSRFLAWVDREMEAVVELARLEADVLRAPAPEKVRNAHSIPSREDCEQIVGYEVTLER
jgi:hypothetical protein